MKKISNEHIQEALRELQKWCAKYHVEIRDTPDERRSSHFVFQFDSTEAYKLNRYIIAPYGFRDFTWELLELPRELHYKKIKLHKNRDAAIKISNKRLKKGVK